MMTNYLCWGHFFHLCSSEEIAFVVQGMAAFGGRWCCGVVCRQRCLVVENVILLGAIFYRSPEMSDLFLPKAKISAALGHLKLE